MPFGRESYSESDVLNTLARLGYFSRQIPLKINDIDSLGANRAEEDNLRLEGSKILLVEDSRINQAFVEEVLAQLACNVTTVSNGQEALDTLSGQTYDLVLMDCQMPVMDGFEATKRICALKGRGAIDKDLPVLALTANAMKGDRQRCMDAGMNDYITKPVRKKELKEKIYFWIKREQITVEEEDETESASSSSPSSNIQHPRSRSSCRSQSTS